MDVATALGTYLEIVDSCAPGLVEGLYVVGSFALGDWHETTSDIDIVAVTAEPASDNDAGALRTAHALLAEHVPRPFVDGLYVAWGDLVTPPTGLHRPWSLQHTFHHDGDCFELNPITWYVLDRYGVTVRGPNADRLGTYVDHDDRVRFVVDNLGGYWQPLADELTSVTTAADAPETVPASLLVWCALGALRLHHTAATGDVISKAAAGQWGLDVAPVRFHDVLQLAMDLRRAGTTGRSTDDTDGAADRASDDAAVPAAVLGPSAELIRWCVADATANGWRAG